MAKLAGKFVNQGEYKAYIPNSLPPEISWNLPLINALSDANRLLGNLAGQHSNLKQQHTMHQLFMAREAVFSCRIEGVKVFLGDVLAAQAGVTGDIHTGDLHEVTNYITALEFGIGRLKTLPLSLQLIQEVHKKLGASVWKHAVMPGEFRRSQN